MRFHIWTATSLLVGAVLSGLYFAASGAEPTATDDAASSSISLEALSRLKDIDLEANPAVKTVVLKLLEQMRGKPEFVEIVRDFKISGQNVALLEIAAKDASSQTGVEAMRLVLKDNNLDPLKQSLSGTNALALTQALGNTGEKAIVPLLEPVVVDAARDAALRREAVRALAKVREGTVVLLDLAKNQKIPDELMLTASSELNSVHWDDLRAQAAQVLPMQQGQDARPLPPIAELAKMTGSATNGAALFRR